MISSTSLDLPQHRAQVVEACLRQGVLSIHMTHLPGRDVTPLAAVQKNDPPAYPQLAESFASGGLSKSPPLPADDQNK